MMKSCSYYLLEEVVKIECCVSLVVGCYLVDLHVERLVGDVVWHGGVTSSILLYHGFGREVWCHGYHGFGREQDVENASLLANRCCDFVAL